MIDLFLILFGVVEIILLSVTVGLTLNSRRKLKTHSECTGTITGFHISRARGGSGSGSTKRISPIVTYSVNGRHYEFIGNYYSTTMKEGQEIKVMYNNDDYSKATIKTGLYFAPLILGALTLMFAFALAICVVLKSKGVFFF